MKSFRIDENGDAVDPATGQVIGRRGPDGRLRMLPPQEPAAMHGEPNGSPGVETSPPPQKPGPDAFQNAAERQNEGTEGSVKPSAQVKPQVAYSKYEVTPESEFTVRFCLAFREDRAIVLKEDARYKVEGAEAHWATFRMWTYREEVDWKNQVMEYDPKSRTFRQNTVRLDELKIRHLLRRWSFEKYDTRFKLLHVGGVLSDESYDIFKGFFPSIIDSIIYMMNNVLESNG